MVTVTFTRPMTPYNSGERAGFPTEEARRLVAGGFAEAEAPAVVVKEIAAPLPEPPTAVEAKPNRKK